ncbi:MAG: ATP-binding cassette domain-containing protein, partial [Myxococcota bacterium]
EVFGLDLAKLSTAELLQTRKRMGMLFQNYALMDSFTVRDNIAFPLSENVNMPEQEVTGLVRDLLKLLDLSHAINLFPNELSGGMKKRVALARALITNPELVLFDEPTTGLDPIMIEFVDGMIQRTQQAYNITSVIISHDVSSVINLADTVHMLHKGRIVERGTVKQVWASDHPWVHSFLHVGGSGRMSTDNDDDSDETASSEVVWTGCDDVDGQLEREEGEPVVLIQNLHKQFGDNVVLKGINLKLMPKKITVVIGGSGSGKSVMMKHVIGLFQPTSGSVKVFDLEMNGATDRQIRKIREKFGMLFQNAALFDSLTVRENVSFPLVERRLARSKEIRERTDEILEQLNIAELADRFPAAISNGQRKRVALARAMITRPEVMIYDEPTTGQDPVMIRNVDNMIEEAQETFDITSVVISHDMVSTFRIADRIAMLYHGQILAYGSPDELKATRRDEVKRFIFAGSDTV